MNLPLIEKYRPQSMRHVLLNEDLKQKLLTAQGGCFVFSGGAGLGKCFGRHTPFLRHAEDSSVQQTVYVQDIVPGDLLVSPTGKPVMVRSVCSGRAELFRIHVPVLKLSFVVNAGHLMTLQCPRTNRIETFTLESAPRDWLLYSGGTSRGRTRSNTPHIGHLIGLVLAAVPQLAVQDALHDVLQEAQPSAREAAQEAIDTAAEFVCAHGLLRQPHLPREVFSWSTGEQHALLRTVASMQPGPLSVEMMRLMAKSMPCTFQYTVEPEGEGEYYGFEVDGHLVQLSSGIVVHNTTTALCIAKDMGAEVLELSATNDRSYDTIQNRLLPFCRMRTKHRKLVVLDEADYMPPKAQGLVAELIEKYSTKVLFLLTCNNHLRLHVDTLHRATVVNFDTLAREGLSSMLMNICRKEGIRASEHGIAAVIAYSAGDVRKCLNLVEALGFGFGAVSKENLDALVVDVRLVERVHAWMVCTELDRSFEQLQEIRELGFGNGDCIACMRTWLEDSPIPEDERVEWLAALHEVLPHINERDPLDVLSLMYFKCLTQELAAALGSVNWNSAK